ncbi:hypothetical protein [Faecalibacter rhinopitheci]|uniref:Lipoprotein n=1 Tax=Faecalibacter rhinopitheci TaxID=2779678 RepID=A0A8J7KIT4_9FLAO|nr:hypothetical protein [Faecalibacter rhinopitheci]MBF0598356.1 hypothetical protein [Faecalibacter rhinopitheci]
MKRREFLKKSLTISSLFALCPTLLTSCIEDESFSLLKNNKSVEKSFIYTLDYVENSFDYNSIYGELLSQKKSNKNIVNFTLLGFIINENDLPNSIKNNNNFIFLYNLKNNKIYVKMKNCITKSVEEADISLMNIKMIKESSIIKDYAYI